MRWVHFLLGLTLLLLGVVWLAPARVVQATGQILASAGQSDAYANLRDWLGIHSDLIVTAGPLIVIAAGVILILTSLRRTRHRDGTNQLDIVFDAKSPGYMEHDVWRDTGNDPLPGMAYRVGIRNKSRKILHDVMVFMDMPDAKPTPARFARHKLYESNIAPRATELVELFMMRDQDIATHIRVEKTVKVRVNSPDTTEISRTFHFDNQASVPLVGV